MADREFKISLHAAQAALFNSKKRFVVCAAGRRFGKTFFAGVKLGIEALKGENERGYKLGPENGVYYIAPTFDQAKRLMWRRLRNFLGYEKTNGFIRSENINDGYFELINGRRIYIKGADNEESLRGEGYSFVVLDEYADMKPHVWDDIIDPALMDVEGGALFIGTPKGKNHFWKLFDGAMQQTKGFEDWEAFHFVSKDNPFIKAKEIARIMDNPNKTRDSKRQELEASFLSGGSKILRADQVRIIPFSDARTGNLAVTVDLAGFSIEAGNKVVRTDESVICVTKADEDDWTVLDCQHGHWDVRETCLRIVQTCRLYPGCRLGIEKGALDNAARPYLEEYMRTFSRYMNVEPLKHNNQRKIDRVQWALQGRIERGRLAFVKADWNDYLLDQMSDFPSPLAHDDGIDALAYADQMLAANFVDESDVPEWEPLDLDAGY